MRISPVVSVSGTWQTDGLWEVPEASSLTRTSGGDFHIKAPARSEASTGGLPEPLHRELADNQLIRAQCGGSRPDDSWIEHFPASMHQHILEAVGLWGTAEAEDTGFPAAPAATPASATRC